MIGLNQILDIAKRSLSAEQYALTVTSHNIANVNTPGYTRQRVIFEPTPPLDVLPGPVGTGVEVSKIEGVRDRFIDTQIQNQLAQVGEWDKSSTLLQQIESTLNEPSNTGLSQMLSDFFNAWNDVSNNPEKTVPRTELVAKATILSNTFKSLKSQFQNIITDINDEVKSDVETINSKAEKIAELNSKIAGSNGQGNSDLQDARQNLVNDLSKLADIKTVEASDGSFTVYLNAKVIVDKNNVVKLQTEETDNAGVNISNILYNGTKVEPDNGELKGLLEVRDNQIPGYISKLDDLAKSIISGVNTMHQSGYGLDGSTGRAFFSGTDASTISVNTAISSNVSLIAASASGTSGDGNNALNISGLGDSHAMENGKVTFSDFYGALVSGIGTDSQTASESLSNEKALLTQLQDYRDSVSAVSLDEESTNMINYQYAYAASAKIITAVDAMFTALLAIT